MEGRETETESWGWRDDDETAGKRRWKRNGRERQRLGDGEMVTRRQQREDREKKWGWWGGVGDEEVVTRRREREDL